MRIPMNNATLLLSTHFVQGVMLRHFTYILCFDLTIILSDKTVFHSHFIYDETEDKRGKAILCIY